MNRFIAVRKTKSGKDRVLPLNTSAVRAAELWHAEPLYQVTRHTLRHTALSWMAQQGEPLQKIARFAGHSSTHVTETYCAHLQPDHLKHAAGVIDAALGNLVITLVTTSADRADAPRVPEPAQTPDKLHVTSLAAFRAGVAKLADARDSKSRSLNGECGFDSLLRHTLLTLSRPLANTEHLSRLSLDFSALSLSLAATSGKQQ